MSGYPNSGLFSSRRKRISLATAILYSSRRSGLQQDENQVRPPTSPVHPVNSGSYHRAALADITNSHRRYAKAEKPLPALPSKKPKDNPKPSSGRGSVYPTSLGSFSGTGLGQGIDSYSQADPDQDDAANVGSELSSDSENSFDGALKVPWSYFGYADLKQLAKVRKDVLARRNQPIDQPIERLELDHYPDSGRVEKKVKFLIGPDEDTQTEAGFDDHLDDIRSIPITHDHARRLLNQEKKKRIEYWLEKSSSIWDGDKQRLISETESIKESSPKLETSAEPNLVETNSLEDDPTSELETWQGDLEESETSIQLRKFAITNLHNLPIRRLNFVTAIDITARLSLTEKRQRKKVIIADKATVIKNKNASPEEFPSYSLPPGTLEEARSLSRAFGTIAPGTEFMQRQLQTFPSQTREDIIPRFEALERRFPTLTKESEKRRGGVFSNKDKNLDSDGSSYKSFGEEALEDRAGAWKEIWGSLSWIEWDREWEYTDYHRRKTLRRLEGGEGGENVLVEI